MPTDTKSNNPKNNEALLNKLKSKNEEDSDTINPKVYEEFTTLTFKIPAKTAEQFRLICKEKDVTMAKVMNAYVKSYVGKNKQAVLQALMEKLA